MSTYIIAEVGVNHNGDMELAKELIRIAAKCGADAVKFQTFIAEELVTTDAKKAVYQNENDSSSTSQYEMLKELELSNAQFSELNSYSKKHEIDFITTCFDFKSLEGVCREINPSLLKIGSGELTNLPFLIEHARTKKNIIMSTGMATLSEVEDALSALAYGYLSDTVLPPNNYLWLKSKYFNHDSVAYLQDKVTLLHCVTDYPANPDDLNLRAIPLLKHAFGLDVGYSDHSLGIEASCAAITLGATCIEKHITIDKNLKGPDHLASATPEEFLGFVQAIRNVERALISKIKAPSFREIANIEVARKYVVAAKCIEKGQEISLQDLEVKRSKLGRPPKDIWAIAGTISEKAYIKGENLL